ncbi:uncharacterized protein LOC112572701 [Pomacea canaliculata]|uniref:uncharacterized protein LOC112572701 n=1 Tax=Pomacea canaliculata TaxID=400727 RepID=UPI000D737944|nr:uncharacterized protein LOC112572701 [Pomacea canaliculata]
MAAPVCMEIFKLCVVTAILLMGVAEKPNMQNVAQNKTCGMSSRYKADQESSGSCSDAINGNTDTIFSVHPPNCIHTEEDDRSPFWWVDLGQRFTINTITIYGRQDLIARMKCVNVSLDGNLVQRFTDTSGWTNNKYDITVGRAGQLVNITRDCEIMALL